MGEIRKATVADSKIIHELAHEIWPKVYDYMISKEQIDYMLNLIYSRPALENQISELKHQFIIYSEEEIPRAFASYSSKINELKIFRLNKLYVHPTLQGKGIGKKLIDYIIQEMKSSGADSLELNVNKINRSIAFYKKQGFEILRPEVIDIGNGYVMDDYVMGKEV